MSIKNKACIVGAYEHTTRKAPDKSVGQLHAESARGALLDAGRTKNDIDGYFCAGDAPRLGPLKDGNEAVADRYRRILAEWEIIAVDAEVAALAARLRVRHKLRLADAIHVATALSTGADALLTHDRDFSGLKGMRIINGSN